MTFVFNCLAVLPTMLIMLILFDIFYMCMSNIVYPVLLPFAFCNNLGKRLLDNYEDFQNVLLSKVTGLSQMEAQGFRSQRTILQLQLESVPQIFF